MVKHYQWDLLKNMWLKAERGVCFDDVLIALDSDRLIERRDHPNKDKYPNQKEFIILIEDYVYVVPFVEDEEKIFLKTVFPSRKETKRYLQDKKNKNANS